MNKVFCFLMLCLYVLGCIGGIGYSIFNGAWPVAAGVAALAYMAWPKVVEFHSYLME